jgi:predicted RNase H-like nuclease (RuvC/YqgF family)
MTEMNPTAATTQEVVNAAKAAGLDPSVQIIIALVGILLALAYPVMLLVRTWQSNHNSAKKEEAVAEGDAATYARMKEQIEQNAKDIRELVGEKNKWFAEATNLKAEIKQLQTCADTLHTVKTKLDEKDELLKAKDSQIATMMDRTLDMQERIHQLELRLARDEKMFCLKADDCPAKDIGCPSPSAA